MFICPNCKTPHESESGKCPQCGWNFHGSVRGKHAVQPRDLPKRYICVHGIPRHLPCLKCGRCQGEECESYKRAILVHLQEVLISDCKTRSEAWERAKVLLDAIDTVTEARRKGSQL